MAAVVAVVLAVDQVTKSWAVATLGDGRTIACRLDARARPRPQLRDVVQPGRRAHGLDHRRRGRPRGRPRVVEPRRHGHAHGRRCGDAPRRRLREPGRPAVPRPRRRRRGLHRPAVVAGLQHRRHRRVRRCRPAHPLDGAGRAIDDDDHARSRRERGRARLARGGAHRPRRGHAHRAASGGDRRAHRGGRRPHRGQAGRGAEPARCARATSSRSTSPSVRRPIVLEGDETVDVRVVFEDADVIVVDKPAGAHRPSGRRARHRDDGPRVCWRGTRS